MRDCCKAGACVPGRLQSLALLQHKQAQEKRGRQPDLIDARADVHNRNDEAQHAGRITR